MKNSYKLDQTTDKEGIQIHKEDSTQHLRKETTHAKSTATMRNQS